MRKRRTRNPRVLAFIEEYGHRVKDPRKLIVRIAEDTIKSVDFKSPPPPFRPEDFQDFFGIKEIAEKDNLSADAMLDACGNGYVVHVRKGLSRGRRSFSIFHEMAHTYFVKATKRNKPYLTKREVERARVTYSEEERLCDIAATELLMPRKAFAAIIQDAKLSWHFIISIAEAYEASLEATVKRIGELYEGSVFLIARWILVDRVYYQTVLACSKELMFMSGRWKEKAHRPLDAVRNAFDTCTNQEEHASIPVRGKIVDFKVQTMYSKQKESDGVAYTLVTPVEGESEEIGSI